MEKKILVYSTPTCPYCVRLKQFLQSKQIEFVNLDVSVDNQAVDEMVAKSGQMGVPVIDIDGVIIVGFDKQKIANALGLGFTP